MNNPTTEELEVMRADRIKQRRETLKAVKCSKREFRAGIKELGKETEFNALLASQPSIKTDWDEASYVSFADPITIAGLDALGIDIKELEQTVKSLMGEN